MSDIMEKIATIELEMSRTQKNKATAAHLGSLKAKLAKLRRDLIEGSTAKSGPKGDGFDVTKTGDCRVGMVGFPSVGKSTLLNKLTGTFSEVAAYEFTTLTCIPGVIRYRGAKIQLLDLPGIIEGAKDGKGRGRQVISTARTCDVIVIVLDALKPLTHKRLIEHELEGFGIRLNKSPPKITYRAKEKGGINFTPNNAGRDDVPGRRHREADLVGVPDSTRGRQAARRLHGRGPHRRHRGQPRVRPVHLRHQQD
jgi:small GTP-binding protein